MTTTDPKPHPWAPLHALILFQNQHQLPAAPVTIDTSGNLHLGELTAGGLNAWYEALTAEGATPSHAWTDPPAGGKQRVAQMLVWCGGRVYLSAFTDAPEPELAIDETTLAELASVAS